MEDRLFIIISGSSLIKFPIINEEIDGGSDQNLVLFIRGQAISEAFPPPLPAIMLKEPENYETHQL